MKHLIDFKLFETLSKEEIIQKASKYKSLLDLHKNDSKLYGLIISNHLENSVFPKEIKWSKEKLKEEAKKYKTRGDFSKNAKGAYIRAKGLNMLDELFPIKKSN